MFAAELANHVAHLRIAWPDIRQQLYTSDAHDHVGCDRRNDVFRVDVRKTGNRGRVRRMQMNDRARLRARLVERQVQRSLLGWWIAGNVLSPRVKLADASRIEKTKARAGRRHEESVVNPDANVSGGSYNVTSVE